MGCKDFRQGLHDDTVLSALLCCQCHRVYYSVSDFQCRKSSRFLVFFVVIGYWQKFPDL